MKLPAVANMLESRSSMAGLLWVIHCQLRFLPRRHPERLKWAAELRKIKSRDSRPIPTSVVQQRADAVDAAAGKIMELFQ